jgi:4a-hydroxytetrahydrobiopterin dehydratase
MTTTLAEKKCIPCAKGASPLKGGDLQRLQAELGGEWVVVEEHHLEKPFVFRNFREALGFVNQVGELAEEQGHHPDIQLSWGLAKIQIWTHKIDGLTESDFIFAAKTDKLAGAPGGLSRG